MTAEEFLTEARKTARPCLYLVESPQDGPLAAVWKGPGLVARSPALHWLTIDCTKLPAEFAPFGLTGAVSIFIDRGGPGGSHAYDPAVKSLNPGRGTALYARPASNLPPLAAAAQPDATDSAMDGGGWM